MLMHIDETHDHVIYLVNYHACITLTIKQYFMWVWMQQQMVIIDFHQEVIKNPKSFEWKLCMLKSCSYKVG